MWAQVGGGAVTQEVSRHGTLEGGKTFLVIEMHHLGGGGSVRVFGGSAASERNLK